MGLWSWWIINLTFFISETNFPDGQVFYEGSTRPHRKDRNLGGSGLLMYVNENVPTRLLKEHTIPDDIEIICGN